MNQKQFVPAEIVLIPLKGDVLTTSSSYKPIYTPKETYETPFIPNQ